MMIASRQKSGIPNCKTKSMSKPTLLIHGLSVYSDTGVQVSDTAIS